MKRPQLPLFRAALALSMVGLLYMAGCAPTLWPRPPAAAHSFGVALSDAQASELVERALTRRRFEVIGRAPGVVVGQHHRDPSVRVAVDHSGSHFRIRLLEVEGGAGLREGSVEEDRVPALGPQMVEALHADLVALARRAFRGQPRQELRELTAREEQRGAILLLRRLYGSEPSAELALEIARRHDSRFMETGEEEELEGAVFFYRAHIESAEGQVDSALIGTYEGLRAELRARRPEPADPVAAPTAATAEPVAADSPAYALSEPSTEARVAQVQVAQAQVQPLGQGMEIRITERRLASYLLAGVAGRAPGRLVLRSGRYPLEAYLGDTHYTYLLNVERSGAELRLQPPHGDALMIGGLALLGGGSVLTGLGVYVLSTTSSFAALLGYLIGGVGVAMLGVGVVILIIDAVQPDGGIELVRGGGENGGVELIPVSGRPEEARVALPGVGVRF